MKNIRFIILLLTLLITTAAFSQQKRVTISLNNVTVKTALETLKAQSGLEYWFNINNVNLKNIVSIHLNSGTVEEALDAILVGQNVQYKITKDHIAITKAFTSQQEPAKKMDSSSKNAGEKVHGKVTDAKGEPLVGVTVTIKGTNTVVVTDANGNYTIPKLTPGQVLTYSFVGMTKKEINIDNQDQINVALTESLDAGLEEVVVVGYGTQKKVSVTGSVVSVRSGELQKAPVMNATQSLAGRVSGIVTRQSSGQPGNDDATIRIRGTGTFQGSAAALVLVDGVERSFSQLDMSEIEDITILKDAASTAVYGVRGANGVVLVTTKKGEEGKVKIKATSNFALQQPTRLAKFVNSYDYAMLWNEGQKNDNPLLSDDKLMFSKEDIQLYKDGTDPLFHPSMNWYDYVMKDNALQQKYDVNVSGGSKFARYYVALGFLDQDGLYKNFNEQYGYNNNDRYKRFNLRSNVTVNLTKTTELNFNLGSRTGIKNRGSDNFYYWLQQVAPYLTPGIWDGKLIYLEGMYARNPIELMSQGYKKWTENTMESDFGFNQKLDFITKGLSARVRYSYDTNYRYNVGQTRVPSVYIPSKTTTDGVETIVYRLSGAQDESLGGVTTTSYDNRKIREYLEAALNYQRTFGKHNVSGLFLYNQNKLRYHGMEYPGVPVSYAGIVGRATYNYDTRYMFEFNLGHNGSENFPKGSRYGWFPAISAGWLVSSEPFFEKIASTDLISYLKFRSSYGVVGNDDMNSRRFLYYPGSYQTSSYYSYFGEDFKTPGGLIEGKLGNPNITWETARKQNYAVDLKMFRDKFSMSFDYFFDKRDNILASRNTLPAMFAATPESENLGRMENRGFEVEAGWNQRIAGIEYFIKGNYSFSRNKVLYKDEAIDASAPYMAGTGRRINQTFGYKFVGFFKDEDDVAQWPVQFSGASTPGDCKYSDINGDGKVDTKDQIPIGYPTYPEVSFAMSSGLSYKGFSASFLFQGATNVSVNLGGIIQQPMLIGGEMLESVKNERWTPETAETAIRPKLTVSYSTNSNYVTSTLWNKDASYVRLKNAEIGYQFSGKSLKKMGLEALRVYVNGENLLTWDKLKIVDPEAGNASSFYYPQLVIYNLGLSLQF